MFHFRDFYNILTRNRLCSFPPRPLSILYFSISWLMTFLPPLLSFSYSRVFNSLCYFPGISREIRWKLIFFYFLNFFHSPRVLNFPPSSFSLLLTSNLSLSIFFDHFGISFIQQPHIQFHEENWENNAWKIVNPSPLVFEPTFFAVAAKYAVTFSIKIFTAYKLCSLYY